MIFKHLQVYSVPHRNYSGSYLSEITLIKRLTLGVKNGTNDLILDSYLLVDNEKHIIVLRSVVSNNQLNQISGDKESKQQKIESMIEMIPFHKRPSGKTIEIKGNQVIEHVGKFRIEITGFKYREKLDRRARSDFYSRPGGIFNPTVTSWDGSQVSWAFEVLDIDYRTNCSLLPKNVLLGSNITCQAAVITASQNTSPRLFLLPNATEYQDYTHNQSSKK